MSNDFIKILLQAEIADGSIETIKSQLNSIQTKSKPIDIKIDSNAAVKSIKGIEDVITKVNATNIKTWKNASGEVYKYTQTLKNLEKGLTIIDTYTKNKKGGFDFTGRTINDKSIEMTYRAIQKAHEEALKMNKTFDETISKNHQMAKDAAWKQYFQGIAETSDKIKELNQHYKSLEDNRPMDTIHSEALRLNKVFDEQVAKAKTLKGTFVELSGEQATGYNIAKKLGEIYGGLEVRGYSLDKVTGAYNVQLKLSAKENLNLAGALEQVNGALSVQSEKVTQARNVQLGFWEQMKIALERVPIWMGKYCPTH